MASDVKDSQYDCPGEPVNYTPLILKVPLEEENCEIPSMIGGYFVLRGSDLQAELIARYKVAL